MSKVLEKPWWERFRGAKEPPKTGIAALTTAPLIHRHTIAEYEEWLKGIWYPGWKYMVWQSERHVNGLLTECRAADSSYLQGGEASPHETLHGRGSFEDTLDHAAFIAFVWEQTKRQILHDAAEWFVVDGFVPFHPHIRGL